MKYLVDTNILSEQMKLVPDPNVLGWLQTTARAEIYTSVFVIGELRKGVDLIALKRHQK